MGDLTFNYTKDREPDRVGYHPEIPIPADMDRPEMLPPPEISILDHSKRYKETTK
jgi:hypothetical protein